MANTNIKNPIAKVLPKSCKTGNKEVANAKKQIKKRESKIAKKTLDERALKISIAAIKYAMLKQNSNRVIIFNKKEAVSFEGDTGPYLQYSYARANSITKRSNNLKTSYSVSDIHDKEVLLAKKIDDFSDTVFRAGKNLNPALIANYTFELSQTFNEFYSACKVIGSEEEPYRIKLVEAFKITLKNSLTLLGLEALDQM